MAKKYTVAVKRNIKILTRAFSGYEVDPISIYLDQPRKEKLKALLPRELRVPIAPDRFPGPDGVNKEIERRLSELLKALMRKHRVDPHDWKQAFRLLAIENYPGLTPTQRGRSKTDSFLERMEILKLARYAANKIGRMTIPQVADLMAQRLNAAQLPGSFKNKGYETIMKALYKAFEEENRNFKADPKIWQVCLGTGLSVLTHGGKTSQLNNSPTPKPQKKHGQFR